MDIWMKTRIHLDMEVTAGEFSFDVKGFEEFLPRKNTKVGQLIMEHNLRSWEFLKDCWTT